MKSRLARLAGCVVLALVLGFGGAAAWAANNNDWGGNNNGGNNGGNQSRGRGMRELMTLIVMLTGRENWGDVRVVGTAGENEEETSDTEDVF